MRRPRVVLAEDSVAARKKLARALEAHAVDVTSFESGAEAMDHLSREAPDLVICDVALSEGDGYAVCEFVRRDPRLHDTPVVLTARRASGAVLERAAGVGSTCVVFEPLAEGAMARLVGELVETHADEPPRADTTGRTPLAPLHLAPVLERLLAIPGVRSTVLVDRDGFVIEAGGDAEQSTAHIAALAARLAELNGESAAELGQGTLDATVLEYERSSLVLQNIGRAGTLIVVVEDHASVGAVRGAVQRALPLLADALGLGGGAPA